MQARRIRRVVVVVGAVHILKLLFSARLVMDRRFLAGPGTYRTSFKRRVSGFPLSSKVCKSLTVSVCQLRQSWEVTNASEDWICQTVWCGATWLSGLVASLALHDHAAASVALDYSSWSSFPCASGLLGLMWSCTWSHTMVASHLWRPCT